MKINIKIGCDIVHKNRFYELSQNKLVLSKIFTKNELFEATSIEKLIGVFAAKEATLKALELKAGSWDVMEVIKLDNGKPTINLINYEGFIKIISQDISISHDGEYVIAFACFLINKESPE